jgi:beta-galactosidase/beta-glucuronidase
MIYRKEYPRPQFVRKDWINLNGEWDFEFDDLNVGQKEKWFFNHEYKEKINVPFAFQAELSGIKDLGFHDYMWYHRFFILPKEWKNNRIILHFGAVDYECIIYINKCYAASHVGGNTSFSVDITDYLNYNQEEIVVYVKDPSEDQFIPRGKQYWKEKPESIWYDRTSGIWQTVWIEKVNENYIKGVRLTPNIDDGTILIEALLSTKNNYLKIELFDKKEKINETIVKVNEESIKTTIDIYRNSINNGFVHNGDKMWSPENPYLYDIKYTVIRDEIVCDEVDSYFGMRKIHSANGIIYLNNRPYFQKLVLDQGYWRQGLLTAPKDEDFIFDIEACKKMGFNGCRKHQKSEDQRFLYHADKLGFIVWGEIANCANYDDTTINKMKNEWYEIINRDYNHPCIITWVPLNESWGVPYIKTCEKQQQHSLALYHFIHSLDTTRFVVSNDGWELTKTDICAIHNYMHGAKDDVATYNKFKESLSNLDNILSYYPAGREIYVGGYKHEGEPVMLTEFGGIGYKINNDDGWGYTSAISSDEFISEYKRVAFAMKNSEVLVGFCYTQLSDVEQEINGLLTYDRVPKVDYKVIKEINDQVGSGFLKLIK